MRRRDNQRLAMLIIECALAAITLALGLIALLDLLFKSG